MTAEKAPAAHGADVSCTLLNADLSGNLEDTTLSWERMIKTYLGQTGKVYAEDLGVGVWLSNAQ